MVLKAAKKLKLLGLAIYAVSDAVVAMVFQVIVPKQIRAFDIGRHRLQFIHQAPAAFAKTNVPDWLSQLLSSGYPHQCQQARAKEPNGGG